MAGINLDLLSEYGVHISSSNFNRSGSSIIDFTVSGYFYNSGDIEQLNDRFKLLYACQNHENPAVNETLEHLRTLLGLTK
jgi:hypothetical protein